MYIKIYKITNLCHHLVFKNHIFVRRYCIKYKLLSFLCFFSLIAVFFLDNAAKTKLQLPTRIHIYSEHYVILQSLSSIFS